VETTEISRLHKWGWESFSNLEHMQGTLNIERYLWESSINYSIAYSLVGLVWWCRLEKYVENMHVADSLA